MTRGAVGARRGRGTAPRAALERRRGIEGEPCWWDPVDQAWAEDVSLPRKAFGRGWLEVPMINNAERLEPLAGADAELVLAARTARGLVALDEGRAWRRRRDAVLAVLRVEVYEDADETDHRAAWTATAEAALADTWRVRWRERDRQPGWVEATWVPPLDRPAGLGLDEAVGARVDWLRVQDHTEAFELDAVTVYEHLVVWLGRAQASLTIRHLDGLDLDDAVAGAALALASAGSPPAR